MSHHKWRNKNSKIKKESFMKIARIMSGISETELGIKIGRSYAFINRIENEQCAVIDYLTARGISNALGVPIYEMFLDDDYGRSERYKLRFIYLNELYGKKVQE